MLYIKLGAARVVDVTAVSVQRHRNVFSNVPDAVYVFRITAGSVTNVFYLIPSGEIKDINSKLITTVAATLSNGGTSMPPILFPGDSVLLDAQSNGADQVAWLTVWEQ